MRLIKNILEVVIMFSGATAIAFAFCDGGLSPVLMVIICFAATMIKYNFPAEPCGC